MTYAQFHERLLSWATEGSRGEDLLAAKAAHFGARGEPHEEDRSYEVRVNAMLDFYLFDWRPAAGAPSTLEQFLGEAGGGLTAEELAAYRALGGAQHSLFEVRRITDGNVRVRDAFGGKDHDVTERRNVAGLEKGDLIEARLMPYQGTLLFSGAFLYHPREARKAVLAEVKRLRKAAGKQGRPDVRAFLDLLARMAMKLERYRNVRLESIYDFGPSARK
jgi:hypothetical protein